MTAEIVTRVVEQGAYTLHVLTNGKFHQHSYCVEHRASGCALVIDPGWEARDAILALRARGVQIERILLTHGHFDHVGGVQTLCDQLDLMADVHEGDRLLLRQAQLYSIRWAKTLVPIPRRVRTFSQNPTWEWAGGVVETIETAGHTAGSVTYCIADMAFTGDTIFYEKVGPTFYPGGDRDVLLASIDRLLTTLRPPVTIFPGHGRPWAAAAAKAWWRDAGPTPETFDVYAEQGESPGSESQEVRDV